MKTNKLLNYYMFHYMKTAHYPGMKHTCHMPEATSNNIKVLKKSYDKTLHIVQDSKLFIVI